MNTNEYRSILEQLKGDLGNQLIPVGCIMMFPNESTPDGFMPCDGRELPIASYPELYAVIGQTFKSAEPSPLELYKKGKTAKSMNASKTVFHLPDMRGQFVRGWDREHNVDSDTDRKFGGLQEDAFQGHSHEIKYSKETTTSYAGLHNHKVYYNSHKAVTSVGGLGNTETDYSFWEVYGDSISDKARTLYAGTHQHVVNLPDINIKNPTSSTYGEVSERVSTETRPKNIALTFCIKVK